MDIYEFSKYVNDSSAFSPKLTNFVKFSLELVDWLILPSKESELLYLPNGELMSIYSFLCADVKQTDIF